MATIEVEKKAKNSAAEARLEDLEVREVSVVDRPANKRKFLIVKRDDTGNLEVTLEEEKMADVTQQVSGDEQSVRRPHRRRWDFVGRFRRQPISQSSKPFYQHRWQRDLEPRRIRHIHH